MPFELFDTTGASGEVTRRLNDWEQEGPPKQVTDMESPEPGKLVVYYAELPYQQNNSEPLSNTKHAASATYELFLAYKTWLYQRAGIEPLGEKLQAMIPANYVTDPRQLATLYHSLHPLHQEELTALLARQALEQKEPFSSPATEPEVLLGDDVRREQARSLWGDIEWIIEASPNFQPLLPGRRLEEGTYAAPHPTDEHITCEVAYTGSFATDVFAFSFRLIDTTPDTLLGERPLIAVTISSNTDTVIIRYQEEQDYPLENTPTAVEHVHIIFAEYTAAVYTQVGLEPLGDAAIAAHRDDLTAWIQTLHPLHQSEVANRYAQTEILGHTDDIERLWGDEE